MIIGLALAVAGLAGAMLARAETLENQWLAGVVIALAAIQIAIQTLKAKSSTGTATVETKSPAVAPTVANTKTETISAITLLGALQRKGRFVDFVMDDVSKYPDSQIGGVARIVHEGCAAVLRDYFRLQPVMTQEEGASVTLAESIDYERYKLLGTFGDQPPFSGRLVHKGWQVAGVQLPAAQPTSIIAPAEIESLQ